MKRKFMKRFMAIGVSACMVLSSAYYVPAEELTGEFEEAWDEEADGFTDEFADGENEEVTEDILDFSEDADQGETSTEENDFISQGKKVQKNWMLFLRKQMLQRITQLKIRRKIQQNMMRRLPCM